MARDGLGDGWLLSHTQDFRHLIILCLRGRNMSDVLLVAVICENDGESPMSAEGPQVGY